MDNKILVIGITGNIGSEVAKHLRLAGKPVKAAVRDINKAKKMFGEDMEYVNFDFEDESTLDEALKDVNKVFLVRPPAVSDAKKYIKPFIEMAKQKNIKQIAFLSLMGIERNPIPPHYKIEKYIKKSGIPYTFLRPSFFMQNLNTTHAKDIKEKNDIFLPAGYAKVSFIDVRDIGEVGAKVLIEEGHENKAYTLTGGEAITYSDVAEIMTKELGRKIIYSNPSSKVFKEAMVKSGIKEEFATVMVFLYMSTKMGMAKKVTPELERLLGRKPTTVEQYVKDYIDTWK